MAKQFDNSLAVLSRPASTLPALAAAVFALICLIGGVIASASAGSFPVAVLLALAAAAIGVAVVLAQSQFRRVNASANSRHLPWTAAVPEVQRQSLNVEVSQLSRILEVDPDQKTDLQTAYIVAEDLALREIQFEEGAPLLRHVSIAGVPFDALLVKNDIVTCVEVAFLVIPDLRQDRIDAIMRKIKTAATGIENMRAALKARLMLVLVTQLTEDDELVLRKRVDRQRFPATPVDIDIRFYDFEALQQTYIAE